MANENSDHWSDYWSRGCLTSLPQDFAGNYDGEVAAFWSQAFSSIPAHGSVVDLCTGNGAIALLAARYARDSGVGFSVTGVDAAEIHAAATGQQFPDQAELLKSIRLIPNTRVEDLELPGEQFELVTSQYGLEYCDWAAAAETVHGLLRPGGRLVLVCHSATSDIMGYMEQEQREYALLQEKGFFDSTRAYLDTALDDAQYRSALQSVGAEVAKQAMIKPSPLFNSVLTMLQGVLNLGAEELAERRLQLEAYHAQMQHGFARLEDMLRVNRAIQANPEWYKVFEGDGLKCIQSGELRYRGKHHAGAFYRFEKSAESN